MKKILVIEDDPQICDVIRIFFSDAGTETFFLSSGVEAIEFIDNGLNDFSLILLDIMLPGADGFTICKKIRRTEDIPIIFITARGREEDILHGYDLGCDDYIVKPFLLSELHSKCMALIKRYEGRVVSDVLQCGDIRLDTYTLRCFAGDREIDLPPKEFAILRYLMEHKNWVTDRDTLLNRIWGYDYFGNDRVVDNHIRLLRKALGSSGKQIKTVIGKGYKLTEK